ncbi:MAG: zinc ribbon domain-containing protein [Armatimonadota bacterium]
MAAASGERKCPVCGATVVGTVARCLRCQSVLPATPLPVVATEDPLSHMAVFPAVKPAATPEAGRSCPSCGAAVHDDTRFCGACGHDLTAPVAVAPVAAAAYAPAATPQAYPVYPATAYTAPVQQAMPAMGYYPQVANNSGTGGSIPEELKGFSWGAFFWTWIWGIAHSVWLSLLVVVLAPTGLGIVLNIVMGLKGNELAWQHRRFESLDEFRATQAAWAKWGWIMFIVSSVLGLIAGIVIMVLASQGVISIDR